MILATNIGIDPETGKTITALNAATCCHSEATHIHVTLTYHVVESKYNICYDGTGKALSLVI